MHQTRQLEQANQTARRVALPKMGSCRVAVSKEDSCWIREMVWAAVGVIAGSSNAENEERGGIDRATQRR